MTARQFRAALRRLGFSQLEAARRMGVDARTVRRWATLRAARASPVPPPVGLLLEAWVRERRRSGGGSRGRRPRRPGFSLDTR